MRSGESGQSLTEYALLVVTIAMLAVGAALMLGQAIMQLFSKVPGLVQ